MDENEVRVTGYCEECGNEITDEFEDVYIDNEGRYFCGIECLLSFHNISKIER